MKKLHICYLGSLKSIHVIKWVQFFKERGYKVSVITFDESPKELQDVTYIINSGGLGRFQYLLAIPKLKKILRELNPDILHVIYVGGYGFMASQINFHPLMLTALGSDILIQNITANPVRIFLYKKILKKTLGSGDFIHCQARHLEKRIWEMGYSEEKTVAFPYGVDLEKFPFNPHKFDPANPVIISTRHFDDHIYNISLLINAAPFILRKIPRAKFILVGDGPDREKFEMLVSKLGVKRSVYFLGEIAQPDLITIFGSSDIYVSTSFSDGASQSLLEAMAVGLFPVVTDIPANREWITNGENGLLCSFDDPRDLAKKIITALKDPNFRERAQQKNLEIIEERGNFFKNMQIMEAKYEELLKVYKKV